MSRRGGAAQGARPVRARRDCTGGGANAASLSAGAASRTDLGTALHAVFWAIVLGVVLPIVGYLLLVASRKVDALNAAAIAADYGSVSADTFPAAIVLAGCRRRVRALPGDHARGDGVACDRGRPVARRSRPPAPSHDAAGQCGGGCLFPARNGALDQKKLLTIITARQLEKLVIEALRRCGVGGYTVVQASGAGASGIQSGMLDVDSSILICVILSEARLITVLDDLEQTISSR